MHSDHSTFRFRLVTTAVLCLLMLFVAPRVWAQATLENPRNDSCYSGIGVISGWKCEANGPLTVRFDGGNPLPLVYGSERGDTRSQCGIPATALCPS